MALHVVDEIVAAALEEARRAQGFQDQAPDLGLGAAPGLARMDALGHAEGGIDLVDQAAPQRLLGLLAREIDHALHAVHFGRQPGLDLQLGRVLDVVQRLAMRAPALPDKQASEQQHQQQHDGERADQVQAGQGLFVGNQFHAGGPERAESSDRRM